MGRKHSQQRQFMGLKEAEIIDLVNHIGDQEKHFNSLETQYRLLASTWLLASLGAIGFLLKDDRSISVDPGKLLLIGCIALVGSIGIVLLWLLDIKVYHKLLNCVFIRGVMLEIAYPWLPKIRTDMLLSQETGDVTNSTGLYYIFSSLLLQLISLVSFTAYVGLTVTGLVVLISGGMVILLVVMYMWSSRSSARTKSLRDTLQKAYKDDLAKM